MCEYGSRAEHHLPAAAGRILENVTAENISRHEVGSELNALEIEAEQLTQGLDQGGLSHPRNAFEQYMPPAENPDEDESMQFGPPEEHGVEMVEQRRAVSSTAGLSSLGSRIASGVRVSGMGALGWQCENGTLDRS